MSSNVVAYYGPEKGVWRCSRCIAKAGLTDANMRTLRAYPVTQEQARSKYRNTLCNACWEYVVSSPVILSGDRVGLVGDVADAAVDIVNAVLGGTTSVVGSAAEVVGVGLRSTAKVADAAIDVVTSPIRWLFD